MWLDAQLLSTSEAVARNKTRRELIGDFPCRVQRKCWLPSMNTIDNEASNLSEPQKTHNIYVFKMIKRPHTDPKQTHREGSPIDEFISDDGYVVQRKGCNSDYLQDNVIAISYAWGLINLGKVAEFTSPKEPDKTLKLGEEWDRAGFLDTLVKLSTEKKEWLWLDQFCLNQKSVNAKVLNKNIPLIYKEARVVVLLPGAECNARGNMFMSCMDASTDSDKFVEHAKDCTNKCIGRIDSWLKRAWPWQEFAYANRLQFRFAARGDPGTVTKDTFVLLSEQANVKPHGNHHLRCLLAGKETECDKFREPEGRKILEYMSNYTEQNRMCSKDTDLLSAVAPAIGVFVDFNPHEGTATETNSANGNGGQTESKTNEEEQAKLLTEGVKKMIDSITSKTETVYIGPHPCGMIHDCVGTVCANPQEQISLDNFDRVGKMSFLHGTHFAEKQIGESLCGEFDDKIKVSRFLPETGDKFGKSALSELLETMSIPQRRVMVRWLTFWEPNTEENVRDNFSAQLTALQQHVQKHSLHSDEFSKEVEVKADMTSKQFMKLCLTLLRVVEYNTSALGNSILNTCELVKIEQTREREKSTAIGYQHRGDKVTSKVVALGDCLLLVNSTGSDSPRVIGRVPFTNQKTLSFTSNSSIPVLLRSSYRACFDFRKLLAGADLSGSLTILDHLSWLSPKRFNIGILLSQWPIPILLRSSYRASSRPEPIACDRKGSATSLKLNAHSIRGHVHHAGTAESTIALGQSTPVYTQIPQNNRTGSEETAAINKKPPVHISVESDHFAHPLVAEDSQHEGSQQEDEPPEPQEGEVVS